MSVSRANTKQSSSKVTGFPLVHPVVRANRIGRTLSHILGFLIIGSVWWGEDTNILMWVLLGLYGFVWPQVGYFIAKQSKAQKRAEIYNLFVDLFIVGMLIVTVQFQPWPTTFIFLVGATTLTTGGIPLFVRGGLFLLVGMAFCTLLLGFEVVIQSKVVTIALSSVGIALFTMMSSLLTYRLTRKVVRMRREMQEKKDQIEGLAEKLAKYLSPQVFGSIFSGEKDVKIETSRKKLTIFFSDIKDFTAITDSLESEDLTSLLNTYFNEMSEIALRYGGTIDKFIGDAIMIFFGDPKTKGEKEDALACCKMALEMRDRMLALQQKWQDLGILEPLKVRMGINTGFCTVGNFGSEDRMDYTIIGSQVNLASRLESSSTANQILISQDTFNFIREEIACKKMGKIEVKGIPYPIQTYQMIDLHTQLDQSKYLIHEEHDGFNLSIDLNRISTSAARSWLTKVLEGLN